VFRLGVAILLVATHAASAQVRVSGRFMKDSVRLGEPVNYVLAARYPREAMVLFPDSTYTFAPFEYQKKTYFPTKTQNNISYDSVVYTLATFEIDTLQGLQLPVFAIVAGDSTPYFAAPDTIVFQHLVDAVPDSVTVENLPLKTRTAYERVQQLFNYPLALIISGVIVASLLAAWAIMGKQIRRYITMRKLSRGYAAFMKEFQMLVDHLDRTFSVQQAERALVIWKMYMENLTQQPYSKFTSKEILRIERDEPLREALGQIDRSIYGRETQVAAFRQLQQYSEKQFRKKLDEVKHG
jgi:hypothetical protein